MQSLKPIRKKTSLRDAQGWPKVFAINYRRLSIDSITATRQRKFVHLLRRTSNRKSPLSRDTRVARPVVRDQLLDSDTRCADADWFLGSSLGFRYSRPSGPIAVTCVTYSPDFAQWK